MDYLKNFVIPFVGLSNEEHRFEFLIDDKFFANFEYSEIKQAKVKVDINLNKSERMMVLTFSMLGIVKVTCSRCLDEFDLQIEGEEVLYIKFGDEYKEEDDDVIVIPQSESQINVAPFIYDYISLMVPFRVVHPNESDCDPEVIKRLEENKEIKDSDPRWDKLRDLNIDL